MQGEDWQDAIQLMNKDDDDKSDGEWASLDWGVAPEVVADPEPLPIENVVKNEPTAVTKAKFRLNRVHSDLQVAHTQLSRVGPGRVESSGVGSGRVESGRVRSSRVESTRVWSSRVESGRIESGRVGSSRVGSSRVESSRG